MTLSTRSIRPLWLAVIGLALVAPIARAQDQDLTGKPIDLVFLVDVSRSMYEDPGNDPQRIRWDAVLLSMDLLTSEDRILIIPFNQTAPAKHELNPNVWVPGKLDQGLVDPRSDRGRAIREKIQAFANNAVNNNPVRGDEWNGDIGGTGILGALEWAKSMVGAPVRGRQQFIILLTDGKEESEKKPEKFYPADFKESRNSKLVLTDENGQKSRDYILVENWLALFADSRRPEDRPATMKVYPIGLGSQIDRVLLTLIAEKTGGHPVFLDDNGKLIDYFRDLIWQLKGCWTKGPPIARNAKGREEDRMWRILDFGALYFKEVQEARPRIYRALESAEALTFQWSDQDGRPLDALNRFNATAPSYTYDYYDRKGLGNGDRLVSSWAPSNSDRRLLFSKRTDPPLFTITEPDKPTFQRYELVPLRVRMDRTLEFTHNQFDLFVDLRRTGQDKKTRPLNGEEPLPLEFNPVNHEFQIDVDLSNLRPEGGDTEGYTLWVTARGKSPGAGKPLGERDSLSGYKLELLPRPIQVRRWLTLRDLGPLTLSNERKLVQDPIRIQPREPVRVRRDMKPIRLDLVQTWYFNGQSSHYHFLNITEPVELMANENGELEGALKIALREKYENGEKVAKGFYRGDLELSGPGIVPLKTPVQVTIAKIKIGFNRSPIRLKSKPKAPVYSEPIHIIRMDTGDKLKDGQKVTVTIPPQIFGEQELWLELNGTPGPRTQSLVLPRPQDEFRLAFQPNENLLTPVDNQRRGYRTLELGVKVDPQDSDYDPQSGKVELLCNAPELKLNNLDPVQIQPGGKAYIDLAVGLEGSGARRRVSFQFLDNPKERSVEPRFRFSGGAPSRILIEPEGMVELTPSPQPEWKPLGIRIKVPRESRYGKYTLENGWLTADLTEYRHFPLEIIVNDLDVLDGQGRPLGLQDRLTFYQITKLKKGEELIQTIQVFAKNGDLGKDEVEVAEDGPFLNLDKREKLGLHLRKTHTKPCRRKHDGKTQTGVEIDLSFSGEEPSFEKYSGNLVIRCPKWNLTKRLPCVVEWVELFAPPGKERNAASTPASP